MSLIADHVNVIQSEEHALCLLNTFCCNCVGVLQGRMDHDHTDNCAKVRICAKCFCSGECNQDLQECVSNVTEKGCKYIDRAGCADV